MITDKMKSKIVEHLRTSLITNSKVGRGGNSTNPTSNTLDVESLTNLGAVINITPTLTASDLNVLEVKISIAGNSIQGQVIREAGIFDTNGDMLARVNFDGVGPFATDETLEIFLLLEVE